MHALLMGNELDSAKEDVYRMGKLLGSYTKNIKVCIDCYPLKELQSFCKQEIKEKDLLIIYYSGHGQRLGKKIKGKMELISTWINPDGSYCYSDTIDKILSKINCQIILLSDSCYSGNFTNHYIGSFPLLFIGSSSVISISKEYNFKNKKTSGTLICLFEEFSLTDICLFEEVPIKFLKRNKIKIRPVIKKYGVIKIE